MISAKILGKGWVLLIFMVVGLCLYLTALDNGFVFDDHHQITENSFIRELGNIPAFFVERTGYSREPNAAGHYRPLLLSTFTINYAIGGLNPVGYHLVNLAFHIGSAFLVFLIVKRMLTSFIPGLIAGMLMLFHPFNSEVVNYVTARSSVMATFFYLLSFYAYIRCRPYSHETTSKERIVKERWWIYLSWGAFVLGILTKEILITLPVILILYEWVFISRSDRPWGRLIWRMVPFMGTSLSYLVARKLVIGIVAPPTIPGNLVQYMLIQTKALATTWQMLLFPVNLGLIHEFAEPGSLLEWTVLGSLLLLVGLLGVMVWSLRSSRRDLQVIGFALAWYYITLLPTTLVPLNVVLQENRGYIAGIAFNILAGLLFIRMKGWQQGRIKRVAWGGLGVVLLVYGIGVIERNRDWDSEINLWQDAVRKAPSSFHTHHGLGMAYQHLGWLEAAEVELRTAVNLNGKLPALHSDLGGIYMYMKREDLAEKEYREAVRLSPQFDQVHTNLGLLYRKRGELALARKELETALGIYPYSEIALYNLCLIYQQQGLPGKALELLTLVLDKNPNLPRIQMLAGRLYEEQGDTVAARRAFDQAIRLTPSLRK